MKEENTNSKNELSVVKTNDGSATLFHAQIGEHYHSHHGALQEAKHVFLNAGLIYSLNRNKFSVKDASISILEVGFGTGLNFLLTADYCANKKIKLHYTSIERYPLSSQMIEKTGYKEYIDPSLASTFYEKYAEVKPQEEDKKEYFIKTSKETILELSIHDAFSFSSKNQYDVLYFDAFSAVHQPEMWTKELLEHICSFLKPGGVFITYAITGNLKRMMKSFGFEIEKVPGAPGKREMLRAVRLQ